MTILYIIGGNGKGYGSEKVAECILDNLHKCVRFIVVTAHEGYINQVCQKYVIENHVVNFDFYVYKPHKNRFINIIKYLYRFSKVRIRDFFAEKRIVKYVDMRGVDIIHTNLSRNLIGGRLAMKYGIPHVWHIQELYKGHYGVSLLLHNQIEWMKSHCSVFVAVSDAVKNSWVDEGLSESMIKRIYNGIDAELICNKKKYANDKVLKIIMIGEICEAKGQSQLIEAIGKLEADIKNEIIVDFYGDGKSAYIDYISKLARKNSVRFCLKGYYDRIYNVLSKYDVGINASRGEGFGLTTLEYMVAGLCVIVSAKGASIELIDTDDVGFSFHFGDTTELSGLIKRIYFNRGLIAEMGVRARHKAVSNYTVDKFVEGVLDVYNAQCYNR